MFLLETQLSTIFLRIFSPWDFFGKLLKGGNHIIVEMTIFLRIFSPWDFFGKLLKGGNHIIVEMTFSPMFTDLHTSPKERNTFGKNQPYDIDPFLLIFSKITLILKASSEKLFFFLNRV